MERMKREIPKHSNSLDRIRALENENKRLEEENKKLKSDLAFERTMLDNVKAEYKSLQEIIKNLERDNQRLRARLDMLGEPTD